ncbi:MAG: hypothetical protein IJ666_02495 [Ruminococcus sp.]|nr:hypothetical protein [Ruminococcus sp.]
MKDCNCTFTKDVQASSTATWLFAVCAFLIGLILGSCCTCCKKKCCKPKSCKSKKNDDITPLEVEDYFEEEVDF